MSAQIRLSRPPRAAIRTLGYGSRAVIWTQGCVFACPGCVSKDTWDLDGGELWDVEDVVDMVVDPDFGFHGLTISGGEPFLQPAAVRAVVEGVRERTTDRAFDVLCYSGNKMAHLRRRHPDVVGLLDVVVDGRFRADLPTELPWRGSANQMLHRLTPLAAARYADADIAVPRPGLQVVMTRHGVEFAGIPAEGELERIERAIARRGLSTEGASWH